MECLNHLNALASISVATVVTDGVNIPYPVDGWKPNYSGTNCGRVYLSYYDYAYVMPGISGGAVDLWQYDRPVQGMYDEIGFKGTAPVTPVPVPTPVPAPTPTPIPTPTSTPTPVTPTTGVDQAADVHGIYLILQWIKALLQKVFNAQ